VQLLREVLEYSTAEPAEILGTSVASINGALQRAQRTMKMRVPATDGRRQLHRSSGFSLSSPCADLVRQYRRRSGRKKTGS